MESLPRSFVTLIFDKTINRNMTVLESKKLFEKFCRKLKRIFPDCWFIYKMEWSNKSGYHFHLIGTFKIRCSKKEILHRITVLWGKLILSDSPKIADVQRCDFERHSGYLTKPSKRKPDCRVIAELNQKSSWGIIGKNNMQIILPKKIPLTKAQFRRLQEALLDIKSHVTSSYEKHLSNQCGCLGFLPPKELKEAIKRITSTKRNKLKFSQRKNRLKKLENIKPNWYDAWISEMLDDLPLL